ncbi:MAG TPA: hypothetical protein VHZ09_07530 [Acidobacteriaceae bacterium]|jgi:hypothetical protein|nr:hypothetical protein [Acidobacteriaceae bacterium]
MEPILVPGPPKRAFDKNRRMSDLIRKQVEHFKHLEEKLPPELRATLPQHRIVTEDDAARYIAPMTQVLLARAAAVQAAKAQSAPTPMPQRSAKQKDRGLNLAAVAGDSVTQATAQNRGALAKKSAGFPKSGSSGKRTK